MMNLKLKSKRKKKKRNSWLRIFKLLEEVLVIATTDQEKVTDSVIAQDHNNSSFCSRWNVKIRIFADRDPHGREKHLFNGILDSVFSLWILKNWPNWLTKIFLNDRRVKKD